MRVSEAVAFVVLTFLAYSLVRIGYHNLKPENRDEYLRVLKDVRWWMVPAGALVFLTVLVAGVQLSRLPLLNISWWGLLSGRSSNVAFGQTAYSGWPWTVFAVVLPVGILLLIPVLALAEERMFRDHSERRSTLANLGVQLRFGLLHSVFAGVSLAFGLAITIGGLYFLSVYQHHQRKLVNADPIMPESVGGGVAVGERTSLNHACRIAAVKSAAAHTVYNYVACALAGVYLIVGS